MSLYLQFLTWLWWSVHLLVLLQNAPLGCEQHTTGGRLFHPKNSQMIKLLLLLGQIINIKSIKNY